MTSPMFDDVSGLIPLMKVLADPMISERLFGVTERSNGTHWPALIVGPTRIVAHQLQCPVGEDRRRSHNGFDIAG